MSYVSLFKAVLFIHGKKYINHEITDIPEFSGEDVVEEVRMVLIKDLALVEV